MEERLSAMNANMVSSGKKEPISAFPAQEMENTSIQVYASDVIENVRVEQISLNFV